MTDSHGSGDTQGIARDVKNILTYISALPHLNASRLSVIFHSYINQLLAYSTPIRYGNISLCFIRSRSSFYAPADSGRLLREMLKQKPIIDITFQKQNIFCFASQSFQSLAVRRCQVEYRNSWKTSAKE